LRYLAPALDSLSMEVVFADPSLDRLETDPEYTVGLGPAVDKGFRKIMQIIRAASDERDLYSMRGLRFEHLKHDRPGFYSMRINNQYRLILTLIGEGRNKKVGVHEIVDYH
jgi:proteic killer suppression protein